MSVFPEDDRPKPKLAHVVGQDLSLLSVHELDERILVLTQEIERLRADKNRKEASRLAAASIFKS
jgi:uncharacterized small protein (DUF1192 family)